MLNYKERLDMIEIADQQSISDAKRRIVEHCEQNPRFQSFVETVLDFARPLKASAWAPDALRTLIWQISNIDIEGCHGLGGVLTSLAHFMGNYFLDDSYFLVYQDHEGFWNAKDWQDEGATQDPQALIDAAIANVKFYETYDPY